MTNHGVVEVIDKTGWSKSYPIDRRITQIGGGDWNHIVVDTSRGTGLYPNQAQLIYLPEEGGIFRLVNLGEDAVNVVEPTREAIAPLSYIDIEKDTQVIVGEFILFFRVNNSNAFAEKYLTDNIQAQLIFNDEQLIVGGALNGKLVIGNIGDRPHTQFEIDLEGLPAECYEVPPPPLLFPNAEAEVPVRIFHRTRLPLAGKTTFEITISAPHAYPGEVITISQTIHVSPHLEYHVALHVGQLPEDFKRESTAAIQNMAASSQAAATAQPVVIVSPIVEEKPEIAEETIVEEAPEEQASVAEAQVDDEPVGELPAVSAVPDEPVVDENIAQGEVAIESNEEDSAWLIEDDEPAADDSAANLKSPQVRVLKAEVTENSKDLDLLSDSADDLLSEIEDGWWSDSDQDVEEA